MPNFTVVALKMWAYRRHIAKIGNFWYKFAPKGYIPLSDRIGNDACPLNTRNLAIGKRSRSAPYNSPSGPPGRLVYRLLRCVDSESNATVVSLLPPIKEEVNVFARVRLSVCLLAWLLKNASMDLDEMLRVDRCRDMDELINFWARSGL